MSYYELFIGSLTPAEFVSPFSGNVDSAIQNVLDNWVWDCPIPEDFRSVVHKYVTDNL